MARTRSKPVEEPAMESDHETNAIHVEENSNEIGSKPIITIEIINGLFNQDQAKKAYLTCTICKSTVRKDNAKSHLSYREDKQTITCSVIYLEFLMIKRKVKDLRQLTMKKMITIIRRILDPNQEIPRLTKMLKAGNLWIQLKPN